MEHPSTKPLDVLLHYSCAAETHNKRHAELLRTRNGTSTTHVSKPASLAVTKSDHRAYRCVVLVAVVVRGGGEAHDDPMRAIRRLSNTTDTSDCAVHRLRVNYESRNAPDQITSTGDSRQGQRALTRV